MTTKPEHSVSTFALDVYWTSGRKGVADLERHLVDCAQCRAYLAMLDEAASDAPEVAQVTPIRAPWTRRLRFAAPAASILAVAAGVALFMQSAWKVPATPTYVGVKGTPSVQVLVHHDSDTKIWDGRSPVHAGDAIALRAACGDLAHVAVAAEDGARAAWIRLGDAPCPKNDDALPFTLVVDGQSPTESIAVVMSAARLADDDLNRAANDSERSPRAWVVRFIIPEERP
jgi:hypothetical protein